MIPGPITLTVTIDPESAEELRELCEANGCTVAELVRQALIEATEEWAAKHNAEPQEGQ